MINNHVYNVYEQFQFEKLQPKHEDQAITLLTHTLCSAEPMIHYLKLEYDAFKPLAEALIEKATHDELSAVALDGDRVVACALVSDLSQPLKIDFEIDPKFESIFSLMRTLRNPFFEHKSFAPKNIAHLLATVVEQDYRNNGLANKTNFTAMQLAKEKGFQFMYCEFSNYLNEKATIKHLKHDKLSVGSIRYFEFNDKNKKPFKNLPGKVNAYLWELVPHATLFYIENEKEKSTTLSQLAAETVE